MRIFKIGFFSFIIFALFISCSGYKPLSHYAKNEIKGKIFVDLYVDLKDPKNSIVIKDRVDKLIIQKLNRNLVYDKKLADTILELKIKSIDIEALQYDSSGYVQLYKAFVNIFVSYNNQQNKEIKSFVVSGENSFSTDTSVNSDKITDRKRFEALSSASSDALDELISKVAIFQYK